MNLFYSKFFVAHSISTFSCISFFLDLFSRKLKYFEFVSFFYSAKVAGVKDKNKCRHYLHIFILPNSTRTIDLVIFSIQWQHWHIHVCRSPMWCPTLFSLFSHLPHSHTFSTSSMSLNPNLHQFWNLSQTTFEVYYFSKSIIPTHYKGQLSYFFSIYTWLLFFYHSRASRLIIIYYCVQYSLIRSCKVRKLESFTKLHLDILFGCC